MSIRTNFMAGGLRLWLIALLLGIPSLFAQEPLKELWTKVDEAAKQDQPRTAIELLGKIEGEARRRSAWPELAKAIILRLDATAAIEGNPQSAFNSLRQNIKEAPPALRPLLRVVQARWAYAYLSQHAHAHSTRTELAADSDDAIESWAPDRVREEVDRCLQEALADADAIGKIPLHSFQTLLSGTELGDAYRPTLLDFIAREALAFYSTNSLNRSSSKRDFRFQAEDPALGSSEEFLNWKPACEDPALPSYRALRIHQLLMQFHRDDADRTAFLHCDLERIRWASQKALGKHKEPRTEKVLQSFIAANAAHPLSADASLSLADFLTTRNRKKEARDVAQKAAKAFPDHPFGKLCRVLVDHLESPMLSVTHEANWTPAGAGMRVQYRNIQQIHLRAYSRPWSIERATIEEDPEPEGDNPQQIAKTLRKLLKGRADISWNLPLEDMDDLQDREVELVAPENLQPGYYWIIASADESFAVEDNLIQLGRVHVTHLSMLVRESDDGGVEGKVVDPVSGAPLAGIEVTAAWEIERFPNTRKLSTTTDADGCFHFKGEIDEDLLVVATRGKDRAITRLSAHNDAAQDPGTIDQLLMMTDRAVYRPGQEIHFKGIWCRTNEKTASYVTVPDLKTTVVLRDSNEREIAKAEVTTNAFGSFSGSFTAPGDSLLGGYTIGNETGRCSLRIEQYKRPKFSCVLHKPDGQVNIGQDVTVLAEALCYNGAPSDGAKVSWKVNRRTMHPDAPWWMMNLPGEESEAIASGEGTTGADGRYSITFKALGDPLAEPGQNLIYHYEVEAVITDSSGETREATAWIKAGSPSLEIGLSCDDWLFAGQEANLRVNTSNLEGEPTVASGMLRIHRLRAPDHCVRPSAFSWQCAGSDPKAPECRDPDTWPLGEVVKEYRVRTSGAEKDKGEALVPFTLPTGNYRAIFKAADAAGVEVENSLSFQVFDPTAKKATAPIPFQLIHSEWSIQPGETYTLLWASGYAEARACVEWFKDGKLLKREWSTPGRTQQTFSWQATEDLRGGFNVRVSQLTMNTHECGELTIHVPWKTKELALKWEHFTSRLTPGAEETWTAVVSDPAGQAAAAEVVATLYDASLDAYDRHGLPNPGDLLRTEGGGGRIADDHFSNSCDSAMDLGQWKTLPIQPSFDRPFHRGFLIPFLSDYEDPFASNNPDGLHWESQLNFNSISEAGAPGILSLTGVLGAGGGAMPLQVPACPSAFGCDNIVTAGNRSGDYAISANSIDAILNNPEKSGIDAKAAVQAFVAPRRNLAETALFLPHLQSDAEGRVRIHFTVPQSLTTWRFLALAHDTALRSGLLEDSAIGSLDLMVQPNPPRFLREGDELEFPVKIINRSDQAQSGEARLELSDGTNQEDRSAALGIDAAAQPFELAPGESCTKLWRLKIPDGAGVLKYKALAGNERISDGEEGWLPIIPRRVLVRDSMSLPIRDAGERKFRFEPLARSKEDASIESTSLELQVVSQPIWNALQAMPYLMEFPHECAEQTFHRYYANALSSHIVRNHPQIRSTLEEWSKGTPPPDPLGANPQLTGILLQETPWLREAEDPAASRHRLTRLLDEKHMDNELEQTLRKLTQMRCEGGLYPWFAGGSGNQHITLIIATGFARLRAAGVPCDLEAALDAITALDEQICRQHDRILREGKPQENHLDPTIAHYLYTRSFFLADAKPDKRLQPVLDYHLDQATRYWTKLDGRMARAHAAIALQRFGRHETAALITRSLKEHSLSDPDQGRWWNEPQESGWWWHSPIETQAMMIEAFLEVDNDREAVRDCQVWLLRQKQVQDWKTTTATADAIHALLLGDGMPSGTGKPLAITLGTQAIDTSAAATGSGFLSVRYSGEQVQADFADITLRKEDAGIAWASIHWQSLRDLSAIEANGSERLSLSKELLVRRNTPDGARLEKPEGPLKVGDEVVSRLVIRNTVAMDYIHLKDPHGSGTEPGINLSGYRWQDNLCYYGSTHDTANHFFIEHLPVGTHVIESSVRIQHAGSYQSGAAEIQCLAAPEFSARSASTKVEAAR